MRSALTILFLLTTSFLFSQAGELDTTFGFEGTVISGFDEGITFSSAITTQSNGKILLFGSNLNFNNDSSLGFIAVRYLSDGQLDSDFADQGVFRFERFQDDILSSGVVDNSDNVFLAGTTTVDMLDKGVVIKLTSEGIMDETFAQGGVWTNPFPNLESSIDEILIQEDGKILIAGQSEILQGGNVLNFVNIIRLNNDGSLDNTFGLSGRANIAAPNEYEGRFVALDSDENIIVGGSYFGSNTSIALIKFTPQGEIDSSFGINGILLDDSPTRNPPLDIAIQSDNKIVIATEVSSNEGTDYGLTRLNQDGTFDNDFGNNGEVSTSFDSNVSFAYSVAIQDDGKIILSGTLNFDTPNLNYGIARYNVDGTLDSTFGTDGKVVANFRSNESLFVSTIQSDGKLLCAGDSGGSPSSSFALARYLTDFQTSTSDNFDLESKFEVVPNPSNGLFTLFFDIENSGKISIDLLTIDGKIIYQMSSTESFSAGENRIDVKLNETLSSGLYIARIQTDRGIVTKKVVVER